MQATLQQRLAPPPLATEPGAHLGLTWHHLREIDVPNVYDLIERCAQVDSQLVRSPRGLITAIAKQIQTEDQYADALVGVDAKGTVRAFGCVLAPFDEELATGILRAYSDPKWRGAGIGRSMLQWQMDRVKQLLVEQHGAHSVIPAKLEASVYTHQADRRRIFLAAGFTPKRSFTIMRRTIDEGDAQPDAPIAGIEICDWEEKEMPLVRELHFQSFSQGHVSGNTTRGQMWSAALEKIAPELSVLAKDSENGLIGYLIASRRDFGEKGQSLEQGYIECGAVSAQYRRRGIAQAMVRAFHNRLRLAGISYASFDVASDAEFDIKGVSVSMGYKDIGEEIYYSIEL